MIATFTPLEWLLLAIAACAVGLSKSGMPAFGPIPAALFATVLPAPARLIRLTSLSGSWKLISLWMSAIAAKPASMATCASASGRPTPMLT